MIPVSLFMFANKIIVVLLVEREKDRDVASVILI